MKKIFLAAMTLVMAVFASCSNDDAPLEGIGDFKVNFTVADKPGFDGDTRAVKTGWEDGDEILIAIQSEAGWTKDGSFNCFKLKYNGSTWTTDNTGFDATLITDGSKYIALYHPGTITLGGSAGRDRQYLTGYNGGEYLYKIFSTYTKTADGIDLGEIELERNRQTFQISIKGLASAGKADGTWKLYIQDSGGNVANGMTHRAAGKAFLRADAAFGYSSTDYSTGINYKGDVVFYFSNYGSDETSLRFKLTDGTKTYIRTTRTIPTGGNAYYLPEITNW